MRGAPAGGRSAMNLTERVNRLVAESLKAGLKHRTSTLRLLLNALRNREKELRRALDEAEALKVVRTLVRQRRDSIEQYRRGGREDLARAEEEEIAILEEFLPPAMGPEEIEGLVREVVGELGASTMRDMGRVMKAVMARTEGRAEGRAVQEAVKRALGG